MSNKEKHITNPTPPLWGVPITIGSEGLRFILSGGGTGGHIYPAIAIANELKERFPDARILFVGAKDRMEMQKVPKAGYEIEGLWISGIQRSLSVKNLMFPFKLIHSLGRAKSIIKRMKPDVVIGTGGYASAPLLRVASQKGIPCLIQEQNSYAGVANKWLAKEVKRICVAYSGMEKFFPKEKIVFTGNPVRQDIADISKKREEAQAFFNLDTSRKTLLVLGGSLGARTINELIEKSLPLLKKENVQLIWQTGAFYFEKYKQYNEKANVQVYDFLYQMDLAYAAADVVISRSGALSVSELCLAGKPVIFIPSPNVAEDHQVKNALAVANEGGAILIEEKDLEAKFEKEFSALIASEAKQKQLAENIRKLAKPDATKDIVDEIVKLIND